MRLVLEALAERRLTVAIAEGDTGGVLLEWLTAMPGSRTGTSRKAWSLAARFWATPSSSRAQSPNPFGPTKKAHVSEARKAAARSSCQTSPPVRYQRSSQGSRPAVRRRICTGSPACRLRRVNGKWINAHGAVIIDHGHA